MQATDKSELGRTEIRAARRKTRALMWFVGIFSLFVNLLMLTGPLYMLNVYDRVLGSRSVETLIALTVLVGFLYAMMALLDYVRGRVMARVGAQFQSGLDRRVFAAALTASSQNKLPKEAATAVRDLEAQQRLLTSPVYLAMFDLPFAPLFFVAIFLFHTWLGLLGLAGAAVLIVIALLNRVTSKNPLERATAATFVSEKVGAQIREESELVQALGMRGVAFDRWQTSRTDALTSTIRAADGSGSFIALTKGFRLFLQSAMLGLGAFLVLQGEMSPGAMIAGSILLGRALAPIEQTIGQWNLFQRAREGMERLATLLGNIPEEAEKTALPRPEARLTLKEVTILPPGETQASVRMMSFEVLPGQALGIIGTSGAGKSTLAKAITGVWRPAGGKIRLGGVALDQFDPDVLGGYLGYLPQRIQLFDGTIRENIARLSGEIDDAAVISAAQKAAAHDMILQLPNGYDTVVTGNGGRLSGGQLQRIGLARALYGNPVLLVLDEPNSNLDNDGSEALNQAIRQMKADNQAVIIMAHRPAAIQECDMLVVIDNGTRRAFGPRDEVLRETVQNHKHIAKTNAAGKSGGVS